MKRNLKKSYCNMIGRKFSFGYAYSYTVKEGLFFSVFVDGMKLAGKKQNLDQRHCQVNKDIVDNYRTMFESRISAGGVEKLPFTQNLRISSWSYVMKVMQRSVWNDFVS